MAITQDYILKGGLRSSDEAANNRLQAMDQERMQKAQQDAQLKQLITGKGLDTQENERQRQADLTDVQNLRRTVGKDANISAGHVKIDPRVIEPGQNLTPGQKAADVNFGKEYSDYVAGGGGEAAKKNLGLLENVQSQLSDPNAKAPNLLERGAQALPDSLRSFLTPKIKMQEDQVRSAIQGTLRQTLGAQFTEKEGEALMRRSYDPRMSPTQNLQKMKPEIDALKSQLSQKQRSAEQFERTGSLVGLGAAGRQQAPNNNPAPQAQPGRQKQIQQPQGGTGLEHLSDEELSAMAKKLGL